MIAGAGPTDPRNREPDPADPEIVAVFEGRDQIRLEDDLVFVFINIHTGRPCASAETFVAKRSSEIS